MNTKDKTIEQYLNEFASSAPVPGGGGVSAVIGATAAAAAQMVCSLTLGKKKFAPIEDEVNVIVTRLEAKRARLLELADEDAKAFEPLAAAYKDKTKTDDEMDELYIKAASVPMETMALCAGLADDIKFVAENGSKLAKSDAGCAAEYAKAAVRCEILNVKINVNSIKNELKRAALNARAEEVYNEAVEKLDKIFEGVLWSL